MLKLLFKKCPKLGKVIFRYVLGLFSNGKKVN